MRTDDSDKKLLALLSANSRESIAELSRKLKLSRSTVKDRVERLERSGIIRGYTLRLSDDYLWAQVVAHVMINTNQKKSVSIVRALRQIDAIKALHAVNGMHDMIAIVSADATSSLDKVLDQIGAIDGVEKTLSAIILSTKFEK